MVEAWTVTEWIFHPSKNSFLAKTGKQKAFYSKKKKKKATDLPFQSTFFLDSLKLCLKLYLLS